MIEILDTTILSNFALVGATAIFTKVLQAPVIPQEVLTEAEAGVRLGYLPATDWSALSVITMTDEERPNYLDLRTQLGSGEAACLVIAAMRGGRVFTDDLAARHVAAELGVPVSGTLGILVQSVREGRQTIEHADALLKQMIVAGYRAPVTSLVGLL